MIIEIKLYKKVVSWAYKTGVNFYRSRPRASLDKIYTKLIIIKDNKKGTLNVPF